MGVKIHGVSCGEGGIRLLFAEAPDFVGVDVTLVKGNAALTARLSPDAWAELNDRYGGPLSGIECKAEPDEHGPAVVAALQTRIVEMESSLRYTSERARKMQEERDAAKEEAVASAPSFAMFQELQLTSKADREAFLEARAALKVAEDRVAAMEAERAPSTPSPNGGRRRMSLTEELGLEPMPADARD